MSVGINKTSASSGSRNNTLNSGDDGFDTLLSDGVYLNECKSVLWKYRCVLKVPARIEGRPRLLINELQMNVVMYEEIRVW